MGLCGGLEGYLGTPLRWSAGCLRFLPPLTSPPSAYGGGASTNFFPHMCLLLPGPGPLPSPHIFFPFASCLGLGCVGRVGGCGPPGLWSSWLLPSQGDTEKRLGLEPKSGSWGSGA